MATAETASLWRLAAAGSPPPPCPLPVRLQTRAAARTRATGRASALLPPAGSARLVRRVLSGLARGEPEPEQLRPAADSAQALRRRNNRPSRSLFVYLSVGALAAVCLFAPAATSTVAALASGRAPTNPIRRGPARSSPIRSEPIQSGRSTRRPGGGSGRVGAAGPAQTTRRAAYNLFRAARAP